MFITVEGIEGVGKSTAVATLAHLLQTQGRTVCVTREPGGTPIAEIIRNVLLDNHTEPMAIDTELLLMFAGRAQHIASVIQPALARGEWVLSDRFTDASYAYQGGGRHIADYRIAALEQWVQGDLRPDVTVLLDASEELALGRAKKRSDPDRIEQETLSFFSHVREKYLARAQAEPERFYRIDASVSLEAVQEQLKVFVDTLQVQV
ncbi:MAG: dTMP kinase [Gammaproteobacteria bacterium]